MFECLIPSLRACLAAGPGLMGVCSPCLALLSREKEQSKGSPEEETHGPRGTLAPSPPHRGEGTRATHSPSRWSFPKRTPTKTRTA